MWPLPVMTFVSRRSHGTPSPEPVQSCSLYIYHYIYVGKQAVGIKLKCLLVIVR